jgi:hypothetical protein
MSFKALAALATLLIVDVALAMNANADADLPPGISSGDKDHLSAAGSFSL